MNVLSDEQKWQLWNEVSHPKACLDAMIIAYGNAVAEAAIAADRAARAEPVAIYEHKQRRDSFPVWVPGVTVLRYMPQGTKLYTAPPAAPVVPEEMQHQPMRADESRSDQLEAYAYVNGWNACRRAMLAAAPAPSQDNEGAA